MEWRVPDYRFVSRLPASHAPSYQTADAHVEWKFTKRWAVAINGRNLLQPHHAEGVGDDGNAVGIRRSVYAGAAVDEVNRRRGERART